MTIVKKSATEKPKAKERVDPRLVQADKDVQGLLKELSSISSRETPLEEEMGRVRRGGRIRGRML